MIVQDLRTTDYRNELKQGIKKLGTLIMQRHFLPQDIEENIRLSMESDSIEDLQMIMIKKLQRYAPIIAQNYHWMVIENNNNTLYYTSDNPIVRDNSYLNSMRKIMNHKSLGPGRGYFSKGVEIQLPLNPHLKLMLLNLEPLDDILREVWSVINKNPQLYPILWRLFPHEDIKKLRMEKLNAEYLNILNFNEKMSGWANRFIFSKTNDFRIAEGLIKRRPEFKNETRNRLEVL